MDKRETEIFEKVIGILKEDLNPFVIILFGSRAKGGNNAHADFDFAVDIPKPTVSKRRAINEKIKKISGLYEVDVVYMSSIDEDFRGIIEKTGKVVYERGT